MSESMPHLAIEKGFTFVGKLSILELNLYYHPCK